VSAPADADAGLAAIDWRRRLRLFAQRFWQPTFACMTCMPGSFGAFGSLAHWSLALQTGLATGILALAVTFTPAAKLFANRWGNAAAVAALTMIGDGWTHVRHDDLRPAEVLLTGAVSGALALAAWYLLEDRARRVRAAWARLAR
jgi:hypothetical protein